MNFVPEHGRRILACFRWASDVFRGSGAIFTAQAYGIAPFIEHSPIMNWLGMFRDAGQSYFIGVIELSTGLFLILCISSTLSALGRTNVSSDHLITLTFSSPLQVSRSRLPAAFLRFRLHQAVSTEGRAVLLAASLVLLRASVRHRGRLPRDWWSP